MALIRSSYLNYSLLTLSESFLSFLWFSRLIIEIVIVTLIIFSEKLLVFILDFVFVVNLLIHKIIYSVFKVLFLLPFRVGGE